MLSTVLANYQKRQSPTRTQNTKITGSTDSSRCVHTSQPFSGGSILANRNAPRLRTVHLHLKDQKT